MTETNETSDKLCRGRKLIKEARNIVAFTGAGISAESGIPTFRGNKGLWSRYPMEIFAEPQGIAAIFKQDPARLCQFLLDTIQVIFSAKPNPAHLALAQLEKMGKLKAVISQNVDNLHQDAGNRQVICLHGNLVQFYCLQCSAQQTIVRQQLMEIFEKIKELNLSGNSHKLLETVPLCSHCGGNLRPSIVLFGEQLPQEPITKSQRCLQECDLLIIVGTSAQVYPAASFPAIAKERGADIIEVNREFTPFTSISTCSLMGKAGTILPLLMENIEPVSEKGEK